MIKKMIMVGLLAAAPFTQAASLYTGDNYISAKAGANSQVYDFSGSGAKKVTMFVPSGVDYDMYLKQDDTPLTGKDQQVLSHCAPYNWAGRNEVCYVNLNNNSKFKFVVKNGSSKDATIRVRVEQYNCNSDLSSSTLKLCPVINAVEKADSYNRGWRVVYDAGSGTHIGVDDWSDDLNWSWGDSDSGLPLFTPFSGRVVYAGRVASSVNPSAYKYGNQVIVYNSSKKMAVRFAHLKSNISSQNQWLSTGDYVGELGNTGTDYSHLHLSVYKNIDSAALANLKEGLFPTGHKIKASGYESYRVAFGYVSEFALRVTNQ